MIRFVSKSPRTFRELPKIFTQLSVRRWYGTIGPTFSQKHFQSAHWTTRSFVIETLHPGVIAGSQHGQQLWELFGVYSPESVTSYFQHI